MDQLLWTQISNIGPPSRFNGSMAYDIDRGRVVLFSGRIPIRDDHGTPTERYGNDTCGGVNEKGQLLGDTWEWGR